MDIMKCWGIACLALFFICSEVNAQKSAISSFYSSETECLSVSNDGSQILKAWGHGKKKKDAVKEAMRNAVRDVIFNGIHAGSKECSIRPILMEVNAQEKYEDFFYTFFADEGAFLNFVTDETPKKLYFFDTKEKKRNKQQVKVGMVARVQRAALQKYLKQEGILK